MVPEQVGLLSECDFNEEQSASRAANLPRDV